MSIRSKLAVVALGGFLAAWTQETTLDPRSSLKINFPKDSPVTLVSADWGESKASARGGAMILDLRTALSLRNSSQRRVRGVTLLVLAQEVTPGGKASVSVPVLDVGPGEAFPIRIDLRLLRPLQAASGPLVQVDLDGVLFDDLSFFGPNRLNSRRSMTVWEMEARRDRRHFKAILEAQGPEGLRREILESLARQADRPRLDVQVARGGRSTAVEPERRLRFAFLNVPDSPIEPLDGLARVAGREARAPRLEALNRSGRRIHYFEIGWIIKDREGREFLAGSVPASDPDLNLAPGEKSLVLQDAALRFRGSPGLPFAIEGMTGFVSLVEFADGAIWVPDRSALGDARLLRVMAPSPEEQRLTELYRKKGLAALIGELKKF